MAAKSDLRVNVSGDTSGLERAFNRASRSLDDFGKRTTLFGRVTSRGFSQVGVAATGMAAALGGVTLAAKSAVDGASDISESLAKNTVLFGSNAKAVDSFSKTTARSFGISRKAALEATGTFGNLFTALGIGQKQSAGMSVELTKLAADLASFNNATPDEALEAIRSGLVGETEPLRRFGVNLNDATLRAEALRMGLVKTTKDALEPQTKALAVNSLIFKQTATAQGDFARTSDGLANQQRILKATFTDVKDSVGMALLPSFTKAVSYVNREVAPAFKGLATDLNRIFERDDIDLGEKLKLSSRSVRKNLGPVVDEIRDAIGEMDLDDKLGDAFGRAAPALINAAATAAPKAAKAFVGAFLDAGVWGRFLTAAFIGAKLGAFKGAGTKAASMFVGAFAAGSGAAGLLSSGKTGKDLDKDAEKAGKKAGKKFGGGVMTGLLLAIPTLGIEIAKFIDSNVLKPVRDFFHTKEIGQWFNRLFGGSAGKDKPATGGPSVDLDSVLGPINKALGPAYPLGKKGQVIGTPGKGTHTLGNWQSDNAVDIRVQPNTPVIAVEDGVITKVKVNPSQSGRFGGSSITLKGADNTYFYTHLLSVSVKAGQKVHAGQTIGRSGSANGVPHLHFGQEKGDPRTTLGNKQARSILSPGGVAGGGGGVTESKIPSEFLTAINRYGPQLTSLAQSKYGISGEALLAKLLMGESGFRMDAVSSAGARGAAQFMPGSRRAAMTKFGVDPWASPDQAVQGAVLHLLGKLGHRQGLEGYNPGGGSKYVKYILGQKVGRVEDVDSFGTPERLGADDFVRIALQTIIKPVRSRFGSLISKRGRAITGLDTSFESLTGDLGRTEDTNALTDEDLSTPGGRERRVSEIKAVLGFKKKRLANREKKLRELKALIATYKKMGKSIDRRLKSKRTSRHLRPALRKEHERILDRIEGYVAEAATLGEDIADFAIDIEETGVELDAAQIGEYAGPGDDGAFEREYGTAERGFDQSREDLSTPEGREKRVGELNALKAIKAKAIEGKKKRAAAVENAIKKWEGRIAAARRTLSGKNRVKGAAAARVRARIDTMEERVIDLKAELTELTGTIQDWTFDLGDIDNEITDVNASGGQSATDRLRDTLSLIDDQERAGDLTPEQARQARIDHITGALAGNFGPITDRERLSLRGDLKQATDANTQALADNTSAIAGLREEIKRQNDITSSVIAISGREAIRALSDVISGQIGMNGLGRQALPGAGARVSYG